MIIILAFFALLLLGIPVSLVVLISALTGITLYSDISLIISVQQMFNGMNNFVLLAIPFFIISGNIAAKGNIARNLINVMRMFFGRIKGGSLIATIIACAFFGAISGSAMATVVAIGSIMIPALVEMGYPEDLAEGTVTGAGSLGILIPPSAPMIMICVAMSTSVGKQFMAGFVPGVLLAIVWSIYVYIKCRRSDVDDVKIYTKEEKQKVWKDSILSLLYPVIVLGGIYSGLATPTEAAAIAMLYAIIVELLIYKTISAKEVVEETYDALVTAGSILFIIACAAVFNWLITTQQIPAQISAWIATNIHSKVSFIFILSALFLVAGSFMDLIALIIILGPIIAPTLTLYGIDPIHFGIIAVLNSQMSYITPPFGLNLFVMMRMRKKSMGQITKAVLPFLIILVVYTVAVSFIPQISLFLPNLLGKNL